MTKNDNANVGPLSHIRVIDFGHHYAGPALGMILSDMGAEVISILKPGQFESLDACGAMLDRGKLSLELDLKEKDGLAHAIALVETADIVIENFRPGVMTRLGLGPSDMRALNPALIYVALPGFASTDEARAGLAAWEGVIASACGQYSDMGLNRVLMGIETSFSPLPLASAYGAIMGAVATLLALGQREKTGKGDHLEIPLASALMEGLAYNSQKLDPYPIRYKSHRERETARRRAECLPMDMSYEALQTLLDPFYRNYICKDGRALYIVCASHRDHPTKLMKLLEIYDQMIADGLPVMDPYSNSDEWPDGVNCTLHSYPLDREWADHVYMAMKTVLQTKTAFEWEAIIAGAGIPAIAQKTTQEWLDHDHPKQSGLLIETDDPVFGKMTQLGPLAWLQGDGHPHARNQRKRVSFDELPIHHIDLCPPENGPQNEPWLDGIKVFDITNVIAGPTIAGLLARFGADIVSVNPVIPAMDPWNTIIFGMHAQRGKKSLIMDLKAPECRDAFDQFIKDSDVIAINGTQAQIERMGLGQDRLKSLNDQAIICRLDCYGGPNEGGFSQYRGYDDLVQASTGIMIRFGGGMDTPEEHAHLGTIDVLGGFCGSLSIALSLYHRTRTGKALQASASLTAAGQLIQMPFMLDYAGKPPETGISGRHIKGLHALYRGYEVKNGWIFLACPSAQKEKLMALMGLVQEDDVESQLTQAFTKEEASHWFTLLNQGGIGAYPVGKLFKVRDDHELEETAFPELLKGSSFAFVKSADHPSGHALTLVAPNAIRSGQAPILYPTDMVKPGADTRDLMRTLGWSDDQIDHAIEAGTLGESWSDEFLPY